ncbi:hypothetical protein NS226_15385 [Aureimonas ureilytica]|uniref:Uncharacterized protein n=1 Tax=Aureimonas ureilytica TaxID=401562 RepID=A0A175R713_9HYPH|nr:hypothetical protein [Aureimonas ureilytica]KTQ92669.1 hypothetical protein NS226_15385 [Aureimonas ureilytica]
MTIESLIARFHLEAQACAISHPSAEHGEREVADALFTVAVAHLLKASGPAAVIEQSQRLIALLEPMSATDNAVEILSADPSLLRQNLD